MTYWRPPNGAGIRQSRHTDEMYGDVADVATAWLPVLPGDLLRVSTSRAQLDQNFSPYRIIKGAEHPSGAVVLEMKIGGSSDTEAWVLDQWTDMAVALAITAQSAGFARLRIRQVSEGGMYL